MSRLDRLKLPFKLPIDHIFTSQSISVDQVITPPPGVSDHRPVIAKLRML
ncbi:MAG: hypothetical protein AAFX95_22520 [Cyanobacteria bacterium J06639_16]